MIVLHIAVQKMPASGLKIIPNIRNNIRNNFFDFGRKAAYDYYATLGNFL